MGPCSPRILTKDALAEGKLVGTASAAPVCGSDELVVGNFDDHNFLLFTEGHVLQGEQIAHLVLGFALDGVGSTGVEASLS